MLASVDDIQDQNASRKVSNSGVAVWKQRGT